jgi:hypothetical protein
MPRKAKSSARGAKSGPRTTRAANGKAAPNRSERLAALEQQAAANGVVPIHDIDRFLDEVGEAWPKDEDLDDFLDWLHQARRDGRY